MENNFSKVSLKEKIGYSLGDAASNLFFQTFIIFLPIFYTDVFGISAAAISTMFLVTRIWDAVNDPIMGMIADRTNSKWGKFRPYLLWLAVPYGVIGAIMFFTPDFSESGKLIYAYMTYTLMMMVRSMRSRASLKKFIRLSQKKNKDTLVHQPGGRYETESF